MHTLNSHNDVIFIGMLEKQETVKQTAAFTKNPAEKATAEKATAKNRYLIQVELLSAIRYIESKKGDKTGEEYYFEVGHRSQRSRTPTKGYMKIGLENEEVYPTSLTLYTQLIEGKEGDKLQIPIWIKEVNDELMRFDDTIAFLKLDLTLGGKGDIHTIKEAGTELKISIESPKTAL